MVHKPINFESKGFKATVASYNVFLHLLMGIVVAIPMLYAFSNTSGAIYLHIVLCVPGYQLLMGQSFLGLCPYNTWSADLNTVNKRRVHWVLALMGSVLAIAGSIIVMLYKNVNFNTLHGKLGLVAMVFTVVNLVTGVAALYATPLRRIFIPPSLSKISHILFGMVAFVTASTSLCYGFDKNAFRNWVGAEVTLGVIIFTAAFTIFLCINPLHTTYKRCVTMFK